MFGINGSLNLQEALAERFTARWQEGKTTDDERDIAVSRLLSDPCEEAIRFASHIRKAEGAAKAKDYGLATEHLEAAIKMDPSAAEPWLEKATNLMMQLKFGESKCALEKAIELMKSRGLASDENHRLTALAVKARIADQLYSHHAALPVLNDILRVQPHDKFALRFRAYCHLENKDFGDAALDFYNHFDDTGVLVYALDGLENADSTIASYDAGLKDPLSIGRCLQQRAFLIEHLAEKEYDQKQRVALYERALADYRASLEHPDASMRNGLFGSARINIRLKRMNQAQSDYRALLMLDKNSLPARILRVYMMDARKREKSAEKACIEAMEETMRRAEGIKKSRQTRAR